MGGWGGGGVGSVEMKERGLSPSRSTLAAPVS